MAEHVFFSTVTQVNRDIPTKPFIQVANSIRAGILTGKLAPGDELPSQPRLGEIYGVARETIKRSIAILRSERHVVTQQGGSTRVRERPEHRAVDLRPRIEAAFEHASVSLDFAGFSSETLRGAISEPLDKIRAGVYTPESITVRLLVTDQDQPTAIPAVTDPDADPARLRERSRRITARAIEGIVWQVNELTELGLVRNATAEVRLHSMAPSFKLYILNQAEAFFGFYPVVERSITLAEEQIEFYDLMGKDVPLFHYSTSEEAGTEFVEASAVWFNSVWSTIAKEHQV